MTTPYKLCPNCQNASPLDAAQCVRCGHLFRTQLTPPSPPPRSSCLYCGAALTGPFCSRCGHAANPAPHRPAGLDFQTLDAAQAVVPPRQNKQRQHTAMSPRVAGWLALVLLIFGALTLAETLGSRSNPYAPPRGYAPAASGYAALAEQMNAPELAGHVRFEGQDDGSLLSYIDAEWRAWTPEDRRRFALKIAGMWADATGNPSALVTFGDGNGTCLAMACAHSRVDGQPYYQLVDGLNGQPFGAMRGP